MLFNCEIKDIQSWGQVFQSIDAFRDLINFIFLKEDLPIGRIENLFPGSNACFKVNNLVVKIFAPIETGMDMDSDYKHEIDGLLRAKENNISSYNLICYGDVLDRYLFHYIVYYYVEGEMVCDILSKLKKQEKLQIVFEVKQILLGLNVKTEGQVEEDWIKKSITNLNLDKIPSLKESIISEIKQTFPEDYVFCHEDITGDNVLYANGKITLLDFADSKIAPRVTEYVPIIFDLFRFNRTMIKAFKEDIPDFNQKLYIGLLYHEYGFVFIKEICKRILHKKVEEVKDIKEIKTALFDFLEK